MTTAWANFVQGRPVAALKTHVAGTALAVVAVATSAAAIVMSVRGKRLAWEPGETAVVAMAAGLVGLILVEWTIRLLMQ
jgi:hypothetical protein